MLWFYQIQFFLIPANHPKVLQIVVEEPKEAFDSTDSVIGSHALNRLVCRDMLSIKKGDEALPSKLDGCSVMALVRWFPIRVAETRLHGVLSGRKLQEFKNKTRVTIVLRSQEITQV